MRELQQCYSDIYEELGSLPNKVKETIDEFLESFCTRMDNWCETQKEWRVVEERADGTIVEDQEEHEFKGGKSGVRRWMKEEGTPKFIGVVKIEMRKQLETVAEELPDKIVKHWKHSRELVDRLKAIEAEASDQVNDMVIYFREPPEVKIDVNAHICQVTTFDTEQVLTCCTTEFHRKVVLYNSKFRANIVKQFKSSVRDICKVVTTDLSAKLEDVLQKFNSRVQTDKASADRMLKNMEDLLVSKMSKEDLLDGLQKLQDLGYEFSNKIRELERQLYTASV